eukprot:gb/GFBE01044518.1/.p1 GENE.gb/GFBE01044518.1/~~gb/GFBE01044518.1/.p1  ORF type:complete len:139 (+),score=49.19 gb/GFBE01044518.1/:1-417(+)
MAAGPDAIWMCVRKTSAFLRKNKNMPVMNAEPGNLLGLNKQKYSGLAHKKAVDVHVTINGKKENIIMTAKAMRGASKRSGKNFFADTGMSKGGKTVKTLARLVRFRPDLASEATTKYNKVKRSFKKRKLVVKSRRAGK